MLVNCVLYRDGLRVRAGSDVRAMYDEALRDGGFVWIGVREPLASEFTDVIEAFQLHPLSVEDAVNQQQRAKIEDFGDMEFMIVKTIYYDDSNSQIETGDLMIYVGPGFVVSIRHGDGNELATLRSSLESNPQQLALGPYAVVHAILDTLVDNYERIVLELEHDVTTLENNVFSDARTTWSQQLYFLKREVIEFRRAADPLRPIIQRLINNPTFNVPAEVRPFFRDVDDHLVRATDAVAALDQLINAALSADMAQVQLRQNEDMRRITAWVALAAAPTMVAGIYGMNFQYMPELSNPYAYPAVLIGLAAFSAGLFAKFKKSGWL